VRFELPRPLIQRPRSAAAHRYRRFARADEGRPWRSASFAVVDLETTGLDARRHEIISWAVVHVDGGRIPAGAAHSGLVRPRQMPDEGSIVVHGILPADLSAAPSPEIAFDELLDAVTGRVVVAHAAWFEKAFLSRAAARRGVRWRSPMIDTSVIGRWWLFERDGYLPRAISLASLTRALRLPAHRPHHAVGDALTTAQAFLAITTHLDAIRPQTAGTLVAARERVAEIRRLEPPEGYPKPWAREPDPEAPTNAAADEGGEPAAVDVATDDAPATG
jgi:DNA polymerase-3 subunit epsilon